MVLIFAFSAMPNDGEKHAWWVFLLRKGAHFSEYALLCALWFRALREHFSRDRALVLGVVLALGYAATDEFHQTFVGGRVGTSDDVVIDVAGALDGGAGRSAEGLRSSRGRWR